MADRAVQVNSCGSALFILLVASSLIGCKDRERAAPPAVQSAGSTLPPAPPPDPTEQTPFEGRAKDREFLETAPRLTLYSLSANPWRGPKPDSRPRLDEFPILGSVEIDDEETRRRIIDFYFRSAASAVPGALCFRPRLGIVANEDERRLTILICDECSQHTVLWPDGTGAGPSRWLAQGDPATPLLINAGVGIEKPEPSFPVPEVTVEPQGILDENAQASLYPELNGAYAECFRLAKLWELRSPAELSTRFRVGSGGRVTRVLSVTGTAPAEAQRCLARQIQSLQELPRAPDASGYTASAHWKLPAFPEPLAAQLP